MNEKEKLCINTIRFLSAEAVEKANSGHPGTPMALAPAAYVLFTKIMRHSPTNPQWDNRDRFVLSAGHASMLLYSMLHLTGYNLPLDELKNFRQWNSKTPGHPEYKHTDGVETTTGPLGAGISNSVGMAIAEKHLAAQFNRPKFPVVDHYTYVIASDGDMMEGVSHEAASLAGHLKLGKLIVLYDDNRITIDGRTDLSFSEDVGKRFEAYGWHVQKIMDGNNDIAGIEKSIKAAQNEKENPSLIILKTTIGIGAGKKEDTAEAHGSPLGKEDINAAKKALGWKYDEPFTTPKEALEYFRQCVKNGKDSEKEWSSLFDKYEKQYPELALQYTEWMSGKLPKDWEKSLPTFGSDEKPMATRASSGKVLNAIAPIVQNLIEGSADLHPSTNTYFKNYPAFSASEPIGRNLHYGIREHAMGGATNGIALHGGLIPLCSTFLVFSDYMRPTIRLSAIMGIRSIFVFTHDSIGLGEDGPTHQPIEHVMSLRLIPNVVLLRPADANEVRSSWKLALERTDGPTVLVLTRQNLPFLTSTIKNIDMDVGKGAYTLEDEKNPKIILVGTGSEVQHAIGAKKILKEKGISVKVVSAPSLELFEKQDNKYKEGVFPSNVPVLSIEAGVTHGWGKYAKASVGIDRFGASAPGSKVMQEFGFTAENVAKQAETLLKKR
jgi:transketolase